MKKYYIYILLIATGIIGYFLLRDYWNIIAISVIVAALFRPLYLKILRLLNRLKRSIRKNDKHTANSGGIAASFTVVAMILTLVIPLVSLVLITVGQLAELVGDTQVLLESRQMENPDLDYSLEGIVNYYNETVTNLGYPSLQQDYQVVQKNLIDSLVNVSSNLTRSATGAANAVFESFTNFILFLTLFSAILLKGNKLGQFYMDISPIPKNVNELYFSRLAAMSKSMLLSIFVIAGIQGILIGIILSIIGVDYALLWAVLATFASIIPLGAGIIGYPISLFLILNGQVVSGIVLAIFMTLIIPNIDNVLRPKLVSKEAKLDEALILLGVFGGLSIFGFMGVIYGPVLMIFAVTSLTVYRELLKNEEI